MVSSRVHQRSENPFASHRTRPGALEFCFPDGMSAEQLVNRLCKDSWRGQIVGPHGAGKSTLIAALLSELRKRAISVRAIVLRDGQRRLPADFLRRGASADQIVLVIDGYEQLSLLWRLLLRWRCWRCGWGLLIATHRLTAGLPLLIKLRPNGVVMEHLFDCLLAGYAPLVSRNDAHASFARRDGNLREVWFDLYDQYERIQRGSTTAPR